MNSVYRKPKVFGGTRVFEYLLLLLSLAANDCGLNEERHGIPPEIESAIANIGDDIAAEHYEKIYNEASELWRRDSNLEQSTSVFKTLRTKLGKVENRSLHSATEQRNSSEPLKGHLFVVTYQTSFEKGEGMETFTLIEQNGRWLLARYFVNSTALK